MAEPIRVSVRVRPFSPREEPEPGAQRTPAVTVEARQVSLRGSEETFNFTHCFWSCDEACGTEPFASQESVFLQSGQVLMADAISGYNGCILAYGQTGSGKSYSIRGVRGQPGLIPRCVADLFTRKAELEKHQSRELRVWISYVELYNDQMRDLIWPGVEQPQEEPRILDHPRLGVCVPQLTEAVCQTPDDVQTVFDFGTKRRVTAATHMNERSSRSHTLFMLRLEVINGERCLSSKVHLVDLAGSERQAKAGADCLSHREGCAINLSLSSLSLVVRELSDLPQHHSRSLRHQAAFRTSKLTLFLKDALAGNCRTHVIATVSPSADCIDETTATLRFASTMGKLRTTPIQNRGKRDEQVDLLQQEIRRLRGDAEEDAADLSPVSSPTNMTELELLLMCASRGYRRQLEHTQELNQVRQASLCSHGLSQERDASDLSNFDSSTPYMLNMSDDPMVAGCLIYHLPGDAFTTIGAADGNSIMLRGIGISEHLCRIVNKGNVELFIEKLSAAGRVCVNGKILHESEPQELHDGDKVYVGRAYALKVTVPLESVQESSPRGASRPEHGLLLQGLEDEWSAIADSHSWAGLQDYLRQVLAQMRPEQAKRLYEEMKQGCKICDEANEITAECRPDENMHFEVDLTSSVPSSVVMRVLQADAPSSDTDQWCYSTLYLWSLAQMSERLERMRDYHELMMRNGVVDIDPILDPWHEPHPGTIAMRLRELEMLVQVNYEQTEAVRLKNYVCMNRRLMHAGSRIDTARCVFGAWATAAKERKANGRAPAKRAKIAAGGLVRGNSSQPSKTTSLKTFKSFKTGLDPVRLPQRPAQRSPNSRVRLGSASAASRRGLTTRPKTSSGAALLPAGSIIADALAADLAAVTSPVLEMEETEVQSSAAPPRSPSSKMGAAASRLAINPWGSQEELLNESRINESFISDVSALWSDTLRTPVGSSITGGAAAPDAVPGLASENEMLRRQLEAALQLCTVLKGRVHEQDHQATHRVDDDSALYLPASPVASNSVDSFAANGAFLQAQSSSPHTFSARGIGRSNQFFLVSGSATTPRSSSRLSATSGTGGYASPRKASDTRLRSETSLNPKNFSFQPTPSPQTPRAVSPAAAMRTPRQSSPVSSTRASLKVNRMVSAPAERMRARSSSPATERSYIPGTISGNLQVPPSPSALLSAATTPAALYRPDAIYVPTASTAAVPPAVQVQPSPSVMYSHVERLSAPSLSASGSAVAPVTGEIPHSIRRTSKVYRNG